MISCYSLWSLFVWWTDLNWSQVLRVQSIHSSWGGQWKWPPQALQLHTLIFNSCNLLEPFFGSVNAELRWLKTYTLYWKSIWFVFVVFLVGSWWIQSTDLFNLKSKIITFVNADNVCWLWDCCFIEKSFPNATIIDAPERKKWKCQRLTRCLTEPLQKWRIHLEEKK